MPAGLFSGSHFPRPDEAHVWIQQESLWSGVQLSEWARRWRVRQRSWSASWWKQMFQDQEQSFWWQELRKMCQNTGGVMINTKYGRHGVVQRWAVNSQLSPVESFGTFYQLPCAEPGIPHEQQNPYDEGQNRMPKIFFFSCANCHVGYLRNVIHSPNMMILNTIASKISIARLRRVNRVW